MFDFELIIVIVLNGFTIYFTNKTLKNIKRINAATKRINAATVRIDAATERTNAAYAAYDIYSEKRND